MDAGPLDEIVFSHHSHQACSEQALVLRAAGIPSIIQGRPGDYSVRVAAHQAAAARQELDAYRLENPAPPAAPYDLESREGGWGGVFAYAMVLLIVAICRDRAVLDLDWFSAGKTSAVLIREGQIWRVFTALTLHADRAHLIANLIVGGLFGLFAARALGSGLAWLGILLAGGAGNFLNAFFRPDTHTSVGASTAVFAALGILAAMSWAQRRSYQPRAVSRFAPLIGGVVLLGYLGTGGARTDVAAHVAGFACGILLGAVFARFNVASRLSNPAQAACAFVASGLVVVAWLVGLAVATD